MKNFKIAFILGLFAISLNGAAFAGDEGPSVGEKSEASSCAAASDESAKKPVVASSSGSSESSSDSKSSSSAK